MHAAQTDASSVPAVGACIDGQMRCLASVLGVCLARELVHVGTTLCTVAVRLKVLSIYVHVFSTLSKQGKHLKQHLTESGPDLHLGC